MVEPHGLNRAGKAYGNASYTRGLFLSAEAGSGT